MKADYPYWKVIVVYTLLGGFIGGFCIDVYMSLGFNPLNHFNSKPDFNIAKIIMGGIFTGFFGIFFGLIPAMTTGSIIIAMETKIKSYWTYLKIFAIGFFVTMLVYKKIPFIDDWTGRLTGYYFDNELRKIAFNSCGGFSAIVCGFFTLPRQEKEI